MQIDTNTFKKFLFALASLSSLTTTFLPSASSHFSLFSSFAGKRLNTGLVTFVLNSYFNFVILVNSYSSVVVSRVSSV